MWGSTEMLVHGNAKLVLIQIVINAFQEIMEIVINVSIEHTKKKEK